ncbi:MAG: D-alanyl-D-alanine carboxypeptidase [Ruminococcaceae bacterium]|nr:D-alanyl-D-alanine carboxypeptidase [Oscillospiraceae bacterium]
MKKAVSLLLVFCVLVITSNATACAKELSLSAQAYVLYCVENDTVLLSKNAESKMKMASTTKIMTTLLTLEESGKNDRLVKFSESMIAEGSSMYLKVGDTVHLSDLAVGMMMASGNDASNAVAITIGGSVPQFAELMNERAKEIGMKNTHFVTPSGLDDENHYSTALDMAYLMAEALENENFCEITKNKSMTVDFLTPQKQVTYQNHNRLLSLYEHCIGGKTGFTKSAGRCLVSASYKDGLTLVCVTLNAPSDWNDHIAMFEYGFERFCGVDTDDSDEHFTVNVVGSDVDVVPLYCEKTKNTVVEIKEKEDIKRTVYIPPFLYAPIKKGDFMGTVIYTKNGDIIAQNALYCAENVALKEDKSFFSIFKKFFK